MLEGNLLGMEMKAACLLVAIKRVAKDGSIQAFVVGTMHTELMGSARLGIERQTEMGGIDAIQNLILRNRLLALIMIHNLAGTIQIIGHQRKGNLLLFCGNRRFSFFLQFFFLCFFPDFIAGFLILASDDGNVFLLNPMVKKLLLQTMVSEICLGNNHQTARCHVETMDNQRTACCWIFLPHDGIDGWLG